MSQPTATAPRAARARVAVHERGAARARARRRRARARAAARRARAAGRGVVLELEPQACERARAARRAAASGAVDDVRDAGSRGAVGGRGHAADVELARDDLGDVDVVGRGGRRARRLGVSSSPPPLVAQQVRRGASGDVVVKPVAIAVCTTCGSSPAARNSSWCFAPARPRRRARRSARAVAEQPRANLGAEPPPRARGRRAREPSGGSPSPSSARRGTRALGHEPPRRAHDHARARRPRASRDLAHARALERHEAALVEEQRRVAVLEVESLAALERAHAADVKEDDGVEREGRHLIPQDLARSCPVGKTVGPQRFGAPPIPGKAREAASRRRCRPSAIRRSRARRRSRRRSRPR